MSAGLLFGLITMLVQYVGLFMLGFHTGPPLTHSGLCLEYRSLGRVWVLIWSHSTEAGSLVTILSFDVES